MITLTGRQIIELAEIAGFTVTITGSEESRAEQLEYEYHIISTPSQGIYCDDKGETIHPQYIVIEEACSSDGEAHPL